MDAAATPAETVRRVIAARAHLDGALLPILHGVQDALGYIPREALPEIAQALNLSRAEVHGVVSYYHHFREEPLSGPLLQVCRAESCQACGGDALWEHAKAHAAGCTVEPVYCLGLCAMSPAVMLGDRVHARMTPSRLDALLAKEGA
jgi:formate dehydrogenase subunit gamma